MNAGAMNVGARLRRPLSVAMVMAMVGAALFATLGLDGRSARADNAPTPWLVTVTPTQNLIDGAQIAINLQTDPVYPIYQAKAQVCRHIPQYATGTGVLPPADFTIGGENCPNIPISTSADLAGGDGDTLSTAIQPGGETFTMYVGSGTVAWDSVIDRSHKTLTCDYQNPCDLVVEVRGTDVDSAVKWIPFVTQLTYLASDPIAGCGGPADGMLQTGTSDRLDAAWVNLTLAQCHSTGAQKGAATGASFAGEGDALDGFSRGDLDLAYAAVGYDEKANLGRGTKSEPLTPRSSVAIPIGLNATVLAVGNGHQNANNRKVPYTDVKMTLDQVAALLAGGPYQFGDFYGDFESNNPQFSTTGLIATGSPIKVGAYADAESTSYYMSDFLHTVRPSLWKVPDNNSFGEERGKARSVTASFGLASPSFQGALDLYTGRIMMERAIRLRGTDEFGGIWFLTDYATAKLEGLTVVQLENANGVFVEPTPDSMAAAIPTMTKTTDGRLTPDHSKTPNIDGVQPYPLTFVEYAIAPTQKLADAKCVERTGSQKLLTDWLTYITGDGQSALPAGLLPLNADLKKTASEAIAKVGTEAPTCATAATTTATIAPTATDAVVVDPPAVVSSRSVTASRTATGVTTAGAGTTATTVANSADLASAELASAIDDMGSFKGSSSSTSTALIALVLVFALVSGSALVTSGRFGLRRGK